MEQHDIHTQQFQSEDEIDLMEIFRRLWSKRRFILKLTVAFLLLGIFIAIFSPTQYTATCTVVPQSGKEGGSGNLGSLAAIAGINLGTSTASGGTLSPVIYPQIAKSLPFTRDIMKALIVVKKSDPDSITLYEFYTDKKYQSFNLLNAVKKYTIGLPGVVLSAFKGKTPQTSVAATTGNDVLVMNKEEERVYKAIQSAMQLNLNTKDGYVTMSYVFPEADGAAQITEQIRKTLEKYVTSFKIEKVEENLKFVEQNYQEARKDFQKKQTDLAAFQDANRGLTSAMARTTEQRLRSEYEVAFTVYNELAKQREQAKIAVKENKPILTLIAPVVTPVEKSAPKRGMILAVFLFLGVVVGIAWVLGMPALKKIVEDTKGAEKATQKI